MNVMLLNVVMDYIVDILKGVFSIIPKLLYFLVSCVLSLIDLCQVGFRKLAGLDPIIITSTISNTEDEIYTGDTVYKIIVDALFNDKYPAIRTVFWSLIILGLFMLVMTSIVAMIRLEYNPDKDKGNSKSGVVKSFFKAIFSFAIIPIASLFGMFLCNALVGVIDTATAYPVSSESEIATVYDKWSAVEDSDHNSFVYGKSTLTTRENSYMAYEIFGLHIPTTSEPFSGIVFRACAYNSNRMRNNKDYFDLLKNKKVLNIIDKYNKPEDAANIIDSGFAINAKLKGTFDLDTDITKDYYSDCSDFINLGTWKYKGINSLSKYNVNAVYYFYDLWSFNYIVAFVAVIVIGKLYYSFILYLMQRMFEVVGLFLVAPISISLMPLDGGASLGNWRGMFITKFGQLVVMVTSLNLVTPLISICHNIKLFGFAALDYIFLTFFLIAALTAVSSLNKMFSKLFTGDDSVDKAAGAITGNFTSGLSAAAGAAGIASRVAFAPAKVIGAGGITAAKMAYNFPKASYDRNVANERKEIGKRIHFGNRDGSEFDNKQIEKNWDSLSGSGTSGAGARDLKNVNSFLDSDAGKNFVNTYYKGNSNLAKRALRGTHGQDLANVDAKRAYLEYLHDREMFEKSDEAARLRAIGASENVYNRAANRYASSSEEDKIKQFVGGSPLSKRQERIQNRIDNVEDAAKLERKIEKYASNAVDATGRFMGKVAKAPIVKSIGKSGKGITKSFSNVSKTLPFKELISTTKNTAISGFGIDNKKQG